jgi:hypothetical protein
MYTNSIIDYSIMFFPTQADFGNFLLFSPFFAFPASLRRGGPRRPGLREKHEKRTV